MVAWGVVSRRDSGLGGMTWVVRSKRGGGLCLPRIWMMSSSPPMWLAAFMSPIRLLTRLRVGILKFALPCSCGDLGATGIFCRSLIVKFGCCSCPIPCSVLAEPAYSCPSPRGGCRACRVPPLSMSFAFVVGSCGRYRVVVGAWGVESRRGSGLLLPACSFPSPRGWYRARQAMRSYCTRPIFVGSSTSCSVGVGVWGVGYHDGGGLGPPWIKLVCDLSMFPAIRSVAVVSPGWRCMRWEAGISEFACFCARSSFCDASGAEAGGLPGRCCPASVCSNSCWQ